jgi:aminocarboxymuconate-semialdehyde decarboxylase
LPTAAGVFGRIDHGWQARPDLCATSIQQPPSHFARRVWVDALVHEPRALALALDVFGPEKLVVGSDYPFPLGEARPGALVEEHVADPQVRARILWQNAWDWLGLAAP